MQMVKEALADLLLCFAHLGKLLAVQMELFLLLATLELLGSADSFYLSDHPSRCWCDGVGVSSIAQALAATEPCPERADGPDDQHDEQSGQHEADDGEKHATSRCARIDQVSW